ncbi:winged helix DNA-binding domain-containing protein [Smaragdicoccus niigatensis]|uniref:winged helix DNA-binding domain-containing protein n=1 Tax=Smaragdicoccus niigatensis TaxID=359359 RepID=UPI000367A384|nr:winged helix DNA-binding domain-containing protein [Smaragdicoccus niigatensis]
MIEVQTGDVIAFRLRAHHLLARRPASDVAEMLGACGIQNSSPGSALLALNARVEVIDRLVDEKTLLQTWSLRGAPYYFPTVDASVFTTGVLPATESARLHLILGVEQALKQVDLGLDEVVALISPIVREALHGRHLAINELGRDVAERVADRLPTKTCAAWNTEGPYAKDQPLGEAIVHFCLRILTLHGIVCFARRTDNKAPFVLVDEWLGGPLTPIDNVRSELLRRYLHCYGPSTRKDFAAWVGVYVGDVDAWWSAIDDELSPVSFNGNRTWMLADDVALLGQSTVPGGVRLLPPGDPYTQLRDRDTIVDKAHHREVWKHLGAPGTVLADGRIVGTWRPRKTGTRLTLTLETFEALTALQIDQLQAEAEQVAVLRGASTVEILT